MLRLTLLSVLVASVTPVVSLAGIVRGPYLQDPRMDRVTIACETDAQANCTVEWGSGFANSNALTASGNHHQGAIENLAVSTCYPYRVNCSGETSAESTFCTAPGPGEPFSFVLFGDTRTDLAAHSQLASAIKAEGVDFYINSGDLVSDGSNESNWGPFFEAEGELMAEIAMFPVVGNHDEDNGNLDIYERLFAPPTESSGKESYYAFSYGNTRFIVIDNKASQTWSLNLDLTQKNWALAEMDAAAADPQIEHAFVMLHEGPYSSKSGRSGDWVIRGMRDDMKSKGVDFVFSGHDHYYERGQADNGLGYIISGGGGAPLYDTSNPTEGDPINVSYLPHTIYYSKSLHHYLRIDINGPHVDMCAKDSSGVAFDCISYGEQPADGGVDAGPDGGLDDGSDGDQDNDAGYDAGYDAGVDAGVDAGADAGVDAGVEADSGGGCDCSGQPYQPVCGEDGVTYDNLCELDCAQVGKQHDGECTQDPCELCPEVDQPVCGTDGVTYKNQCLMQCMGVQGEHSGACEVSGSNCGCAPTGTAGTAAGGRYPGALGSLLLLLIVASLMRSARRRRS